jgi:hypothetical protein
VFLEIENKNNSQQQPPSFSGGLLALLLSSFFGYYYWLNDCFIFGAWFPGLMPIASALFIS